MLGRILSKISGVPVQGSAAPLRATRAIPSLGAALRRAKPYTPVSRRRYRYSLDTPLLWFGKTPFTIRTAAEGVAFLGNMGSGKSSSGRALALAMLKAGFGFLVLCKKKDECATWQHYARLAGREKSVLIVHPSTRWRFNLTDYFFTRPGEGGGNTENAVSMYMHILEARREASGKTAQEQRFFTDNARRLLRYLMEALLVAGERVSTPNILKALHSLPQPQEGGQPVWHDPSYLAECLGRAILARRAGQPLPYDADPEALRRYFENEFARGGSDRQSSGIISTLTGMMDPLAGPHMLDLFGGETNFLPGEFIREGGIVIVDLPLDEWEELGRTAALALKFIVQKCLLRRQGLPPGEVPVGVWIDEYAQFATHQDRSFQEAARSSVACSVYLSQNINNIIAALGGGSEGEAHAYGILAGLGTKILLRNDDYKTNTWAAETIAKAPVMRKTGGSSTSQGGTRSTSDTDGANLTPQGGTQGRGWSDTENRTNSASSSEGFHEEMDFQVQPELFTRLKSGGPKFRKQVQAIIFRSGETFATTGKPFTGATFMQE
jgi:hypothetical protein